MAIDLLPDLSSYCIELSLGTGELCVEFPGGAKLCASAGVEFGDPGTIVTNMLAQINTALVPLTPFFNIIDVVKQIFDCIQAIPDCIGPPPDPSAILACIPNLQKAIDKLLAMLPPLSIPKLAKSILHVIIEGLRGVRAKLLAMIRQVARILAAATAAAQYGNAQLQLVVDCTNANLEAQLSNVNASFAPLNRLIGLINVLLQLAGQDCIPSLAGIAEVSEAVLAPLDASIELLTKLMLAIPALDINLALPALPPPGECA